MFPLLLASDSAAPAAPVPFPELGRILDDPAQLQEFMNVDFGDAPQAEIDAYLARERELLRRWAEADPQRECRQDRCLVTLGRDGRPVMVVERATKPGASPTRRYDHAAQRARSQEHYTLNLEVEGRVRLLINGVEPFIYGTVTDRAESSTFVNDWLVVGANTFELVPLSKKARVRFAVGGHAPFIPAPDTRRANRPGRGGPKTACARRCGRRGRRA